MYTEPVFENVFKFQESILKVVGNEKWGGREAGYC
jgi:hypothetical protein